MMPAKRLLLLLGVLLIHPITNQAADDVAVESIEENSERYTLCANASLEINFNNLRINTIYSNFLSSPLIECLYFHSNGIQDVQENAFVNLPNLKYLELSDNSYYVNNIFNNNFEKLEILVLNGGSAYNNEINIEGIYPKIRKLFLKRCGIHNIRAFLGTFPSLTHLSLSGNLFPTMDYADWFPLTLEYLDLSDNPFISTIRLRNKPNLRHLVINNNGNLAEIYLNNLLSLKYLDLSGHNLNSIILNDLPNLKQLVLSNGYNSQSLQVIQFNSLLSLQHLSLPSNKIRELLYSTFVNMSSLIHLDISSNEIGFVEVNAFDDMQHLQFLNLSNNVIDALQGGTLDNLSNLKTLILEKNIIRIFPLTRNQTKLEFLSLSCNRIRSIVGNNFAEMNNLKSLYLHDNEISHIDQQAFAGLENLKLLTLSRNKLSALPANWMTPLLSLEELDLTGNNFVEFENVALNGLLTLKNVYLANQIKIMHGRAMLSIAENVTLNFDETFEFIGTCTKVEEKYSHQHYG